ncbi:MAG TPA: hypothetical protein H9902_14700 [Candidatus Stackebrandtia faecavium]|nr:hypothetical protein [Candidatus Stackebrandtia faecavium]
MRRIPSLGPWRRFVLRLVYASGLGAAVAAPPQNASPPAQAHPRGPDHYTTLMLDSSDAHLKFTVRLGVVLRCNGEGVLGTDANHIAHVALRRRAQLVTERFSILQSDEVHANLALELRKLQTIGDSGVAASATCEEVAVNEEDERMMRRYQDMVRARYLARFETEIDEYVLRNYGSLIGDPFRATAWWFSKNPEATQDLPAVADGFLQLFERLRSPEREEAKDSYGNIIDDFLARSDEAGMEFLSTTLLRTFKDYERDDLSERWGNLSVPGF